jgi:hypothetical protein
MDRPWLGKVKKMASKVSALGELAVVASEDLIYIIDDPAGTPLSQKITVKNLLAYPMRQLSWFAPLAGVAGEVFLTGEYREEDTGLTANYATEFGAGNQHLYITADAVTIGGDIVITGTSISESSALPVASDTETITIDTTVGQSYQTSKKWLDIQGIDITSGAITGLTYTIGILGYMDMGNSEFTLYGYRFEARSSNGLSDIRLRIRKVQDDGSGKWSFIELEDIGMDSGAGTGEVVDHLRTAANDRSYTAGVNIWASDAMFGFKQLDFETFFSSNENHLTSNADDEGLIVQFAGEPSGGLSNVENATLTLFYKITT